MRGGIILAVAMTAVAPTLASTCAQAEEWCGYGAKDKSLIECGYSSVTECQSAVGQGGTCFVDPDYALNVRSAAPASHQRPLFVVVGTTKNNGQSADF
jgi:hypothetical protein